MPEMNALVVRARSVSLSQPMVVEITTLGLRNLQSAMGVHKTFIDFELPNGKR